MYESHLNDIRLAIPSHEDVQEVMLVGRSLDPEYRLMFNFDVTSVRRDLRILDIAAGVSSFTFELRDCGFRNAFAVDPVYARSAEQIREHALGVMNDWVRRFPNPNEAYDAKANKAAGDWVVPVPLPQIDTPQKMFDSRIEATEAFLMRFTQLRDSGVCLPGRLPELEDVTGCFDLILCGNYLVAYTADDPEYTVASIRRMADLLSDDGEIRIFPAGSAFAKLEQRLVQDLKRVGLALTTRPSAHRFVRGWDAMYVIRRDQ